MDSPSKFYLLFHHNLTSLSWGEVLYFLFNDCGWNDFNPREFIWKSIKKMKLNLLSLVVAFLNY
jgi:hypothetical protein